MQGFYLCDRPLGLAMCVEDGHVRVDLIGVPPAMSQISGEMVSERGSWQPLRYCDVAGFIGVAVIAEVASGVGAACCLGRLRCKYGPPDNAVRVLWVTGLAVGSTSRGSIREVKDWRKPHGSFSGSLEGVPGK